MRIVDEWESDAEKRRKLLAMRRELRERIRIAEAERNKTMKRGSKKLLGIADAWNLRVYLTRTERELRKVGK